MLYFVFILFVSHSALTITTPNYQINTQLAHLKVNPMEALTVIENNIKDPMFTISQEDREALIDELISLKSSLCKHPGAGLLILPILATLMLAGRSYYHYHETQMLAENASLWTSVLGLQEKAVNALMYNLGGFCLSFAATLLLELEYREKTSNLFVKERRIERKIDELIALLKA